MDIRQANKITNDLAETLTCAMDNIGLAPSIDDNDGMEKFADWVMDTIQEIFIKICDTLDIKEIKEK